MIKPIEHLKAYGQNWVIGFEWLNHPSTKPLEIYARFKTNEPHRASVGTLKEAMEFLHKLRVPARSVGKFMAEAMSHKAASFQ